MPDIHTLSVQLSDSILSNVTSRIHSIHSYPDRYHEGEPCPTTNGSPGRFQWLVERKL